MANKLYREEDVRAVADAIRAKNESTETYTLSEMADAILAIESGGSVSAPLIVHSLVDDNGSFAMANFKSVTVMSESMGREALSGCGGLESVTLDGVTSIGEWAFSSCSSLTSIIIPDSVTSVGNRVFYSCYALASVTFKGTPSSIAEDVFDGCDNLTTINVPWAEGAVSGAPWSATNATINYNYSEE